MAEADPTAHFAKPFTDEQVEGFRRDWNQYFEEIRPPVPPMGNVVLALELTGAAVLERTTEIRGLGLRIPPLSYVHGLRLTELSQQLGRVRKAGIELLKAGGEPGQYIRHLEELRPIYAELRAIFRAATRPMKGDWGEADPFYEVLEDADYWQLLEVLLDAGDECPIRPAIPRPDDQYRRYNAAHVLLSYLSRFGAVPGWIVDGKPASWRHYRTFERWLTEEEAHRLLADFGAFIMPQVAEQDIRTRWLGDLQRRMGP